MFSLGALSAEVPKPVSLRSLSDSSNPGEAAGSENVASVAEAEQGYVGYEQSGRDVSRGWSISGAFSMLGFLSTANNPLSDPQQEPPRARDDSPSSPSAVLLSSGSSTEPSDHTDPASPTSDESVSSTSGPSGAASPHTPNGESPNESETDSGLRSGLDIPNLTVPDTCTGITGVSPSPSGAFKSSFALTPRKRFTREIIREYTAPPTRPTVPSVPIFDSES